MSIKKIIIVPIVILLIGIQKVTAQKSGTETAGDIGLIVVPITALSVTLFKGDNQGTWQFTSGFLLNQAVTYGLKVSINKSRPDYSDNNAFPSGHTSTTFQGASFIHRRYGFKYSIPAYLVAGFTAFSRIDAKKHDGLDILAGAVIGIGSTLIFTSEYQKEHMQLTFNNSEGSYLLGFKYKF